MLPADGTRIDGEGNGEGEVFVNIVKPPGLVTELQSLLSVGSQESYSTYLASWLTRGRAVL